MLVFFTGHPLYDLIQLLMPILSVVESLSAIYGVYGLRNGGWGDNPDVGHKDQVQHVISSFQRGMDGQPCRRLAQDGNTNIRQGPSCKIVIFFNLQ